MNFVYTITICGAVVGGAALWYFDYGGEQRVNGQQNPQTAAAQRTDYGANEHLPTGAPEYEPASSVAAQTDSAATSIPTDAPTPAVIADSYSFSSSDQKSASDRCSSPSLMLVFTGVTIKDGVMTCSISMDDVNQTDRKDELTGRQGLAFIFETMHDNYAKAASYVVYYKAGYNEYARRYVLSSSAFKSSEIGRGDSGVIHYDETKLGEAMEFYQDGLRQSDW